MNLPVFLASMAFACGPLNSSTSNDIQQLDVSGENFYEYVVKDVNHCLFSVLGDSIPHNQHEELDIDNDSTNYVTTKTLSHKFVFDGYVEVLTRLFDNFTFQQYSDKPGLHGNFSVSGKNVTFSEGVFYTPEKGNPMGANFVTDLIGSYDINKKISVGAGAELSIYPKQKDENMFAGFLMADYHPNDKISANLVTYKPICSLDGDRLSNLYLLGTFKYNISDKSLILRTMTSCEDKGKTQIAGGFSSPIGENMSVEFTATSDGVVLGSLRYSF